MKAFKIIMAAIGIMAASGLLAFSIVDRDTTEIIGWSCVIWFNLGIIIESF